MEAAVFEHPSGQHGRVLRFQKDLQIPVIPTMAMNAVDQFGEHRGMPPTGMDTQGVDPGDAGVFVNHADLPDDLIVDRDHPAAVVGILALSQVDLKIVNIKVVVRGNPIGMPVVKR